MSTVERTAFHEAGHAVAYLDRGRGFRYVTIRSSEPGTSGQVAVGRPQKLRPWDRAFITLAGPGAELMAVHLDESGDLDDAEAATGFLLYACDRGTHGEVDGVRDMDVPGQPYERTVEITTAVLVRRWHEVDALARALLVSPRRLTYRQAVAVVEGASPLPWG